MSDLISTPSQTQSPVSNEAFESLIDFLASDGIDEIPSKHTGNHTRPQANMSLRAPSGKLDFDKIRLMFASQNKNHRVSVGQEKNFMQSLTAPQEDGDSDDDHHSHRSTSTVPSRTHSMSPNPVERPSAGHRRSSTFGNQPWAAMHENAAKVVCSSCRFWNYALTVISQEDVAPTPSRQPLSFDEVNVALACAHEEVRSLQQQYDALHALVAKRMGTELREQSVPGTVNGEKGTPVRENGRVETPNSGSEDRPSAIIPLVPPPLPLDVPTEIADLSEDEAKRVLSVSSFYSMCDRY